MHPARPSTNSEALRWLVLIEAVILGAIVVLLRHVVVPEHFMYDGYFIQRIAQGRDAGDVKYTNTAAVYSALGLSNEPVVASMGGYLLAVVAVTVVWLKLRRQRAGWSVTIAASLTIMLAAIYLGWYSKDVLVLLVTIITLLAPKGRIGWLIIVLSTVMYAFFFRDYWYLVAVGFIVLSLLRGAPSGKWLLFAGAAGTVVIGTSVVWLLGYDADAFRSMVNEARAGNDVGTLITPFVSLPDPVGGIVNNLLTYFALIAPLPVLLLGGVYYVGIAFVVGFLWISLLRGATLTRDTTSRRSVALVIAFVSVQAVFEPDYGSALRHLTPLLPLFVWVIWQGSITKERPGETAASSALESDGNIEGRAHSRF